MSPFINSSVFLLNGLLPNTFLLNHLFLVTQISCVISSHYLQVLPPPTHTVI